MKVHWKINKKRFKDGSIFRDLYRAFLMMILLLILVGKFREYYRHHTNFPLKVDPVISSDDDLMNWDMEESYVIASGDYLFNSEGKSVDLVNEIIYAPHSDDEEIDVRYEDTLFEIYTDAKRQHIVVLTYLDELYVFDANLEKKLISEDVEETGISFCGNRVFYIKYSDDQRYRGDKMLYIYDTDSQYDFGRLYWNEEIVHGAISPNGRYFAAYQFRYGNYARISVLDLEDNCKELYTFNANAGDEWDNAHPMYISNDGKIVYCKRSTDEDIEYMTFFIEGTEHKLGDRSDYGFAIFNKDMTSMVLGQGNNLYYYSEDFTGTQHIEDSLDKNMYINRKCFNPNITDGRIYVETEDGFGGFIVRGKFDTHFYDENMKRVDFSDDFKEYLFSYSDDGVTAVYYENSEGFMEKAVIRDGEVQNIDFDMKLRPLEVTSNESYNKLWVVTEDYEIYCIDGSNDTVTCVTSIDKDYNYEGYIVRYSKMDKHLYCRDGAKLYSLDPENGAKKLITDDCYKVDAPNNDSYLLHYHIGNNENEYVQIGNQSVRIR